MKRSTAAGLAQKIVLKVGRYSLLQ